MSDGKRLAEISEVREKEDGVIVQVVEEGKKAGGGRCYKSDKAFQCW